MAPCRERRNSVSVYRTKCSISCHSRNTARYKPIKQSLEQSSFPVSRKLSPCRRRYPTARLVQGILSAPERLFVPVGWSTLDGRPILAAQSICFAYTGRSRSPSPGKPSGASESRRCRGIFDGTGVYPTGDPRRIRPSPESFSLPFSVRGCGLEESRDYPFWERFPKSLINSRRIAHDLKKAPVILPANQAPRHLSGAGAEAAHRSSELL